ncbi:unnamed protein product [Cyprideis torosa]|uniref:Glycosyltransferase 2-like domain-containing protein n=1 Tax=Cyprideis torosa TaxID=163714 RepID=A0A7R8WNJ0_9CRUS|nr:unnamed protein product [Cyprideis torosa]CAG0900281.1 unnamed protein product [Cyprideis torosa]
MVIAENMESSEEARGIDAAMTLEMGKCIATFSQRPCISIILPTYNSNLSWLKEAISSVQKQIYSNWQLCIADDASTDPALKEYLASLESEDSRITLTFRANNGHISLASNSAIESAQGEWIAFLDHDDILAVDALFWVVFAINEKREARLIYSDEDKIDERGRKKHPYFKPDWNRRLFYSHNLITHLAVYHANLIRQVGGLRKGFEGAQDYDLALRCIEHISPEQIYHIPRVLYSWRIHAESTSKTAEAKPYAMLAGERALNQHFQRLGLGAKAELQGRGYRIHYSLPDTKPTVTIIIPTRNGLHYLEKAVSSIVSKTRYAGYGILIVDNGSDDEDTLAYLQRICAEPNVDVLREDREFNFSAINNRAVDLVSSDIIALLNNDVEVISPHWLEEMAGLALQPDVGAVGARLWYPDDTLQHGGIVLGLDIFAEHAHKGICRGDPGYVDRAIVAQEFSAVTAACLVVERAKYFEVGGLDEKNLKIAYNDIDFCLRLREMGYRNVWTPHAEMYHHESVSRGEDNTPDKWGRFQRELAYMQERWGYIAHNDPSYNPNLTLDSPNFGLAWPPRFSCL